MISFHPTEEETEFSAVAGRLAREKIRPEANTSEANREVEPPIIQEVAELGFLALELPEDWMVGTPAHFSGADDVRIKRRTLASSRLPER
ncbi:acyl-CoA dehydrogenase family protein [Lentibacillus sp. CBA3610]|uniref:acyl-CoA dehydrogenase family protein n=1 Tax=Lentibacillus sp. CBA3610 TaxID=2518176 RepID=UPI001595041C|nr:acyl-CoA dehydrogenase family protein [Lentibacillus sp. CBA3610]